MTVGPAGPALVLIEFQREWLDPAGKINHLMADRAQFDGAVGNGAPRPRRRPDRRVADRPRRTPLRPGTPRPSGRPFLAAADVFARYLG